MSFGRDYLHIVLRLRTLVPEWVEDYAGPPELIDAVDGGRPVAIEELRGRVQELAERVAGEEAEPDRRCWLLAQLRGIATALRWLGGEQLSYTELFERCHGASVELVGDHQFEQAHALLDRALPGRGDIGTRYRAWRQTQLIPRGRLGASLELLAEEMRRRCQDQFGLPSGELVRWELVSGERYAGNATYLGQRLTRIRINVDLPISAPRLLELVCHEAYPGHHTENVCKQASLIEGAGREELAVFVYPTPQPLISEGLACCAIEALLGDDAEQQAAACLQPEGIAYDHETAAPVRTAQQLLLPVRSNIALMLDTETPAQQIDDYARTWLLEDAEQIGKSISQIQCRSWRPYESCYPIGLALCRPYAVAGPRRFEDLLHRQLVPADLAQ